MREIAERFIFDWLNNHDYGIDILNSEFIDGFAEKTGAKTKVMLWGANKCSYANSTLNRLYHEGRLTRDTISLGVGWQSGLPKWVFTYSLTTN